MKNPLNKVPDYLVEQGWNWKTITIASLYGGGLLTASIWLGLFREGIILHLLALGALFPVLWGVGRYLKKVKA